MLTKNAVGNLINRYKAVLGNCRLLNVLGTCALAATVVLGGVGGMVGNAWAVDITTAETITSGTHNTTDGISVKGGGTLEVSGGTYNAGDDAGEHTTIQSGTLKVSGTGTYNASGNTNINGWSNPKGTLEVSGGTYNATGGTNVEGGTLNVTGGTYNAGDDAGDNTSVMMNGILNVSGDGTYNATGDTSVNMGTLNISGTGTYNATGCTSVQNGTLTISGGIYNAGSTDATWVNDAVTNVKLTAANYAIFAIGQAVSVKSAGKLNVGNVGSSPSDGINFGDESLLVVDGLQFPSTGTNYALEENINVTAGAKLLIASGSTDFSGDTATVNVAKAGGSDVLGAPSGYLTIAPGAWGYNGTGTIDTDTIFTDSKLLGVTGVEYDTTAKTYVVTLGKVSVVNGYEDGALLDKGLATQIDALDTNDAAYDFFSKTNAKGAQGAVALNINGGTLPSVALAGSSAIANVDVHNSLTVAESPTGTYVAMNGDGIILPSTSREMTKGFGIWAMPMYKHTNANDFATGNQEYGFDANIYGMTLGADYTFDSNLRLGAALHVGTGTVENSGDLPSTENDFDYFGMTAYAAKHFNKLALTADLGFTASSNDIEQAGNLKSEANAMLFTAGVKAEYLLDFKSFDLTPYIGARINHYELDDHDTNRYGVRQVRNYASDATIVEFPMGFAIATDLKSGNWTLTPSASLGVKFAAGDLEADQEYRLGHNADTAIMTSEIADAVTFQGTLGLGMKKDVYSVDLGYTLDMSEHVQSHGLTVNLRYEF